MGDQLVIPLGIPVRNVNRISPVYASTYWLGAIPPSTAWPAVNVAVLMYCDSLTFPSVVLISE